jgi:hypothetical protein
MIDYPFILSIRRYREMPLTPPKKRTYWISIIFFILGLVFFILGLVEWFVLPILAAFGLAFLWLVLTFIFLFLAWFMLFGGVSWKGF